MKNLKMFSSKFNGSNCGLGCKSKCRVHFFKGAYGECEKAAEAIADYYECDCRGHEEWVVETYLDEFRIKNCVEEILYHFKRGFVADNPYRELITMAGDITRLAAYCLLAQYYGSSAEKEQLYETIQRSFKKHE